MALQIGSLLTSYEITGLLGAGGMGEVYRARDSKLNREVAIKVLPGPFSQDAERLARFHREAQAIAALNHPNIGGIYELGESQGAKFLVLELVEGETLADRIRRGPIPIEESIHIAKQICEALEAAHDKGIVHRDLKPANVKITPDGIVKVLDFGLAKADQASVNSSGSQSPTLSLAATNAGVILGTAAYMSPEQASGYPVDRRADIWSFGAVLFEMLSGRQPFLGESVSDTLATVLKLDPDWDALPTGTPDSIRKLVRRCLTKDRKRRLQAIGEARILLESPDDPPAAATAPSQSRRGLWTSVVAGIFAVAFAAVSFIHLGEKPPASAAVQRFEIPMPGTEFNSAVISPDGSRLVFYEGQLGRQGLYIRALDSLEANKLPGTEGVVGLPFWSPDGRYIAFTSSDRKLKKIDVEGGAAQVLCDAIVAIGGFWTSNEKIVFANQRALVQIPASGGTPSPVFGSGETDTIDRLPVPMPDRRHFLFLRISRAVAETYVASLDDGLAKPKKLMDGQVAAFAPSPNDRNLGYLLFVRAPAGGSSGGPPIGTLLAQRFDLRKLETIGESVPLNERVALASASRTGVLVFTPVAAETGDQLTIFDRQGKVLQMLGEPDQYSRMSFSPDASRIVAGRASARGGGNQVWMFDLMRELASRFATDPAGIPLFPVWSPDGSRIVFASERDGKQNLYQRLSNGGGEDELLLKPDEEIVPLSWSRNGRYLGVGANAEQQTQFVINLDSNGKPAGKPVVFVRRGLGIGIEFSPDAPGPPRWVAYQASRDRRTEVYLREFDPNSPTLTPANGAEWQVSKGGGTSPHWNPNGKELFYLAPDRTIMAVDLTGNAKAPTGLPKAVFKPEGIERASQAGIATLSWDVSPDGKMFLFPIPVKPTSATSPLTVVLNWTSLLKQ